MDLHTHVSKTKNAIPGRLAMTKKSDVPSKLPTFDRLMNPLLRALRTLGGSGSIEEIFNKVVELENFAENLVEQPHNIEKSNQTEIEYRLAWARTYLKKYGHLENSARGVWSLTSAGKKVDRVDPQEVVRMARGSCETPPAPDPEEPWKQELHALLTQKLDPASFERLAQRLLRESGFIQVEVSGRSGDGGIDGRGIARINRLMSFHVVFQCKRYKKSVSPSEIRDFRGAMVGRADKGLFITTGTFTPAAIREASRDGAPALDLIDGDELAIKLKELGLGVRTETFEVVKIDEEWFKSV